MKNYAIGETPSININKALAEAENHWQYIQSIDVDTRKTDAIKELERSRNLLNSIKNLFDDESDTAQVRDNLEGFKIRLDDLENYIYKSRNSTEAVRSILHVCLLNCVNVTSVYFLRRHFVPYPTVIQRWMPSVIPSAKLPRNPPRLILI